MGVSKIGRAPCPHIQRRFCERTKFSAVIGLICSALVAPGAFAQSSENAIEEVIVTAQRTSENIQEVPIAVTALTGTMLEDRQITMATDLQMNAPNVSFSSTNFGGSTFSIRGIGRLVTAASGENGVSEHINDIPITSNLNAIEFFDISRVEVLRGPQGTLYGRNATGGAVNVITNMPDFSGTSGYIDLEVGDYNNQRRKAMFNLAVSDTFALRVAGIGLERDGYVKNLAFGQLDAEGNAIAGIDSDIDGRDLHAFRATAKWQFSDAGDAWVQYSKFKEDDDRARISNQVCEQNPLPVQGCLPNGFGFDTPHNGSTTGGLFGGFFGAYPLGDNGDGLDYDYPRPETGFRSMHTDFDPIYQYDERIWSLGLNYEFADYRLGIVAAHQETAWRSQQDYNMDVAATFTPILPAFPTSAPAGGAGADWTDASCNYNSGTSGVPGGCIFDVDQTRGFAVDQTSATNEYWTVEAKVTSDFDGKFNFIVGASAYDRGNSGDYYVAANTLDILGILTGAYPGTFNNTRAPDNEGYKSDGYAVFAEGYYDVSDRIKLTVGLRRNTDDKFIAEANAYLNASFITPGGEYSREAAFAQGSDTFNEPLAELYGATSLFNSAVGSEPLSDERLAAVRAIPLVPQPGEQRKLTGSPQYLTFEETTGRIGLDFQVDEDKLLYAFFSTGYKPGGFNPPVNPVFQGDIAFEFGQEEIRSFEIGSKNSFLDGRMKLNGTLFTYDYEGLQMTRIAFNSSINDNVDAKIWGAELELEWVPEFLDGVIIDATYSYLNTEVDGATSVDPTNRTAGNPDWITLNNVDVGPATGVNYVARLSDLDGDMVSSLTALGAAIPLPGTVYPNGIPAYISRTAAEALGVTTSNGLEVNIDGNELPQSPEHTFHIGGAYTLPLPVSVQMDVIARIDYYWQDDTYAREFNTIGDEIDAWDQWNASLIFESTTGRWSARAWIRNIQDEDNVTGHYLTADTSGFFRNYFLTEPRLFGASFRYNFGDF